MDATPARLDIYRTAIAMRGFEHAAARRDLAEAIVVRLQLSDGRIGWGETLPRDYVTGETLETVPADIEAELWPRFCAEPDAPLPQRLGGRAVTAAACALDVARADATLTGGDLAGARRISARVSGVLGSADPARTATRLRLMRWFGLRDFKLKLGLGEEVDAENLRLVERRIGRAVAAGRCSLRVDVNGGWDAASTPDHVAALARRGVCVVEQPVFCGAGELADLAGRCELPLMADESLVTAEDAEALLGEPQRVWWNIRLSKNGGLRAALTLARRASERGVTFTLGCMVGESCILSAAQRRALQLGAGPRFVEGNYGRWLLAGDLSERSPRFSYGGRLRTLGGGGLGAMVSLRHLAKYGRLLRSLGVD